MTEKIRLFYVTHASKSDALAIIESMLSRRLIACGNVFPIESAYVWQSQLSQEGEYVSILKSLPANADRVVQAIEDEHPYDVPCIISWDVHCNAAYANWIKDCMR